MSIHRLPRHAGQPSGARVWCARCPDGHSPDEDATTDGVEITVHVLPINAGAGWDLELSEVVTTGEAPMPVVLDLTACADLDATGARALAAALLRGADALDVLTPPR